MRNDRNFWANVVIGSGCWEWRGSTSCGYGRFYNRAVRRDSLAHRYAWIEFNGEVPEGMDVLHNCDNRVCVRPDHMRLGTDRDNATDRAQRGPSPYAIAMRPREYCKVTTSRGTSCKNLRAEGQEICGVHDFRQNFAARVSMTAEEIAEFERVNG